MKFYQLLSLITIFLICSNSTSVISSDSTVIKEDFNNLENWEPLHFKNVKNKSVYSTEVMENNRFLKAESNNSASAIVYKSTFNVYKYPKLKWRWKVSNVYNKGNANFKEGDDYPLRIIVLFPFDSNESSFWEKAKYKVIKALYNLPIPHSGLNYNWANKDQKEKVLSNPHTERLRMFALEIGNTNVGQWVTEQVDLISDYREAFGNDPPEIATLAIMNDSDNTKESSVSYVDFIELLM